MALTWGSPNPGLRGYEVSSDHFAAAANAVSVLELWPGTSGATPQAQAETPLCSIWLPGGQGTTLQEWRSWGPRRGVRLWEAGKGQETHLGFGRRVMESLTGASPLGVTFFLALGVVTSGSSHPRGWSWQRLDTSFWGLAWLCLIPCLPHSGPFRTRLCRGDGTLTTHLSFLLI